MRCDDKTVIWRGGGQAIKNPHQQAGVCLALQSGEGLFRGLTTTQTVHISCNGCDFRF